MPNKIDTVKKEIKKIYKKRKVLGFLHMFGAGHVLQVQIVSFAGHNDTYPCASKAVDDRKDILSGSPQLSRKIQRCGFSKASQMGIYNCNHMVNIWVNIG